LVENAPVSMDVVRAEFGLLIRNQELFQQFAERHEVVIEVRPGNPDSVRHLEQGALYKPWEVKPKTINHADVLLGVKREYRGLVGFFHETPRIRPGLTRYQRKIAERRRDRRVEERRTYAALMNELSTRPPGPGRYVVIDHVVYGYVSGQLRPVAGDHDLYDVYPVQGRRLPRETHLELIEQMRRTDMGVTHGTVVFWHDWTVRDQSSWKCRRKLIGQACQEGVIRFAPGQPMRWVKPATPLWHNETIWCPPVGKRSLHRAYQEQRAEEQHERMMART
jgi:hypothetical protein